MVAVKRRLPPPFWAPIQEPRGVTTPLWQEFFKQLGAGESGSPVDLPFVLVTAFGVSPNNSRAENTRALNALFADPSIVPSTGTMVVFPAGVYEFNGNIAITAPVTIVGIGREITRLDFDGGGLVVTLPDISASPFHLTDLTVTSTKFGRDRGLSITGPAGLNTPAVEQVILERLVFRSSGDNFGGTGYWGTAIYLTQVADVHIVDVEISTLLGVLPAGTVGIRCTGRTVGIDIEQCGFVWIDKAIHMDNAGESLRVKNTSVTGANYGVYLDAPVTPSTGVYGLSDGMQVTGCDFACALGGIYAEHTAQGNFSSNYLQNFPPGGANFTAIQLIDSSQTNRVHSNICVKGYPNVGFFTNGITILGGANSIVGNVGDTLTTFVTITSGLSNLVTNNRPSAVTTVITDGGTDTLLRDNQLDDHKVGVWTPKDWAGTALAQNNVCNYVKDGPLIYVDLDITYTVTADGSAAAITNLPYASIGTSYGSLTVGFTGAATTVAIPPGASALQLFTAAGAAYTNAAVSGRRMIISGSYRVP